MANPLDVIVITTTYGAESDAVAVARRLTQARLAACVQIFPIRSLFVWQGEDCDESEWLVTIKTSRDRQQDVLQAIRASHPYQTPELLVFEPANGTRSYLDWVAAATREE